MVLYSGDPPVMLKKHLLLKKNYKNDNDIQTIFYRTKRPNIYNIRPVNGITYITHSVG